MHQIIKALKSTNADCKKHLRNTKFNKHKDSSSLNKDEAYSSYCFWLPEFTQVFSFYKTTICMTFCTVREVDSVATHSVDSVATCIVFWLTSV